MNTIVRSEVNRVLFEGYNKITDWDVDLWWYTSHPLLNKQLPIRVYLSGAEGRQRVMDAAIAERKLKDEC